MSGKSPARLFSGIDLLLFSLVVVWGVNYSVIKFALRFFSPLAFNACRFALATATVLVFTFPRCSQFSLPRQDFLRACALGILANAVYQYLFIEGMAHTTAANASLIQASLPVQVAILSCGRERLAPSGWSGVALAAAGLFLLLSMRPDGQFISGHLLGDMLMLLASFSWAVYTRAAASLLSRQSAAAVTTVGFLAGTPVLCLFAFGELKQQRWAEVPWEGWAAVLFSGGLAIGLGYWVWNLGLRRLGSTRTAVYSNLTPVVAAALGWFTLGEQWTAGQALGAAFVLVGVNLTRRARVLSHREEGEG